VGDGIFVTVSLVGKDWARTSGPWTSEDDAVAAVNFAAILCEEFTGTRTSEGSTEVVKLKAIAGAGAQLMATEDKDNPDAPWAVVYFTPKKPGVFDSGTRFISRALAEEAMRLAK
jgi:hypothetical protein